MDECPKNLRGKPNSSLSDEERQQKKHLKKALRFQTKVNRLEKRILHAQRRHDLNIENEAKEKLEFLLGESKIIEDIHRECSPSLLDHTTGPMDQYQCPNKTWILHITERLFRYEETVCRCEETAHESIDFHEDIKKVQTLKTLQLLKHMTKGTQERTMFTEPTTLWGYAKQKFFERAMLFCSSMQKLQPCSLIALDPWMTLQHTKVWKWILAGNIRQACSLGCGPGNDAIGLVSFLECVVGNESLKVRSDSSDIVMNDNDINFTRKKCSLERILLYDFAIDDWVKTILNPLKTILGHEKPDISLHWGYVNVSHTFIGTKEETSNNQMHHIEDSDIFLISYLLTETRDQWKLFFQGLIHRVKPHSLFYFAEPTPWQLHRFKELFQEYLDFIWLDSSMYYPSLQSLDGRVGPAVLLAVKK